MMRSLLFLFLQCAYAASFAQSLTVIIDTVETSGRGFSVDLDNGFWDEGKPLPWDVVTEPSKEIRDPNTLPNYVARFDSIAPARSITIPLDTDGGVLVLKGVDRLKEDTLRIDRVKVWRRCIRDTTWTRTFKYPMLNGELGAPKVDFDEQIGPDPGCTEVPVDIVFCINGKRIRVPITLRSHGMSTTGHRYDPRDCNDRDSRRRKRCTYIYTMRNESKLVYFAELSLE